MMQMMPMVPKIEVCNEQPLVGVRALSCEQNDYFSDEFI